MHKKILIVIGITILFIGVSFQPIIAEETVSVEKTSDYENYSFEKAKEYLFQTLVDISNNPEVKELIKQNNQMMFTSDYYYKDLFLQIFFKKPRLLKSIIFTKPEITYEYLETNYNNGIELINILGEEKALEIIEFVSLTNTELLDKFNNIVFNNIELSYRVTELVKLNTEIKLNLPLLKYPIICAILFLIFLSLGLPWSFFTFLYQIFQDSVLKILVIPWIIMLEIIMDSIFILTFLLGCWYPPVL